MKRSPWMTNKQADAALRAPVRLYKAMVGKMDSGPETDRVLIECCTEALLREMARNEILRAARVDLDVSISAEDYRGTGDMSYIKLVAIVKDKP